MASIRKRSENSYQITVSCGYDSNGKKLRKMKTVILSEPMTERQKEKELQKQAALFEREVENNKTLNEVQICFKQFLQINGYDAMLLSVQELQELMSDTKDYLESHLQRITKAGAVTDGIY